MKESKLQWFLVGLEGKFWGGKYKIYISTSYLFSNIKHKTFIYLFLGAPSGLRSDNFKLSLLFLLSLSLFMCRQRTAQTFSLFSQVI